MADQWRQFKEWLSNILKNVKTQRILASTRITYKVGWNLLLLFFMTCIVVFAFAGGVGAGYFAALVKDEPIRDYESMKTDLYNYNETTQLYFANNDYLGKLSSDLYREEVDLEDVSPFVVDAIIATEDQLFHEHHGVVPKAVMRAVYQELTNADNRSGGSTLTQQIIKNQILTNEVSFDRKAKEILLAMRLERYFKKEDIIEAYLNIVPFGRDAAGRNIAGVQTAARGIFGIDASELNLAQSAYIAGLPQSPSRFTPFTNFGEVKPDLSPSIDKMHLVLSRMFETNIIDEQAYEDALAYDVTADFTSPGSLPNQEYPWLTVEIEKRAKVILLEQLAAEDGVSKETLQADNELFNSYYDEAQTALHKNGYTIHTTIQKDMYDRMQDVKNQFTLYGSEKPETIIDPDTGEEITEMEPVETGAMLIENSTGRILSFVAGRDHERQAQNHATSALRSNGSTMKPLLVYAPALELGVAQPGTLIADVKYSIRAGSDIWSPSNYGGGYHGLTSARRALASSYNIPAAKLYVDMLKSGHQPTTYLEKMGVTSLVPGDKSNYSMALGALTKGITVEENVNAFSTFGNQGKFTDAYLIEKIVSKDNETVYEHETTTVDVFSPQTNFMMLSMLEDVISGGTAVSLPGFLNFQSEWAGKTGTSQNYNDAWFVATNPKVTFGVWMGYDTPKPLEVSYQGYSYGSRNIKLWAELMNVAYDVNPELVTGGSFERPDGVVQLTFCGISGKLPSELCQQAGLVTTDLFNAKYVPTERDNSFIQGEYVSIQGTPYSALSGTPSAFTRYGAMLNPAFIQQSGYDQVENPKQLLSGNLNLLTPRSGSAIENGRAPAPVFVNHSGSAISWSTSDTDVVGYYVYRNGQRIATVPAHQQSISAGSGDYNVVAIDIAGNQSPWSNTVTGESSESDTSEDSDVSTEDENASDTDSSTDVPDSSTPASEEQEETLEQDNDASEENEQ
ncbi:transglycosylase domain-containing protein [Aureibacillus halotolerans]|uniref:Penicillin-binding protein n=1 Tax=Aureibacillus halotolerans TaxID=1508390 RepID=A0A4R6TYQ5_9BACI|nr:transglycosylase domain-containing protein [Aureibacillus halotolerans]TDQ39090.1 penicillin-binding protein [Aureibacillus halotolerans]